MRVQSLGQEDHLEEEMAAMRVQSLGQEDPLEEEMATHSSILAWKIPWSEEPGGLQFSGYQRVRHDRAVKAVEGLLHIR